LISFEILDSRGYKHFVEGGVTRVSRGSLAMTKGKLMCNDLYKLIGTAVQGGACNEACSEVNEMHCSVASKKRVSFILINSCKEDFHTKKYAR
jgi:hypothetical protein